MQTGAGARLPGGRRARPLLIAVIAALGMLFAAPAARAADTIVSLQFDDGTAGQTAVGPMLAAHGLHATFFVNSDRIGRTSYMSQAQLAALQSGGNEIAGHTLDHLNLTTISTAEARHQVCDDRSALITMGFPVTDFAYPFGAHDASSEAIVHDCGYDSARTTSGLRSPAGCFGCPYAEVIPPPNPYATRTPQSIRDTTSLADIEQIVNDAELHGGGLVQLVMHVICDGCDTYSISQTKLQGLLDFLAAKPSVKVETVHEALHGGPPPPVADNADLGLDLSVDPNHIRPGDLATYTLKVTNHGPGNVTGATVTDPLPTGVTFVSSGPACHLNATTVTCTFNFIAAGGYATQSFVVRADPLPDSGGGGGGGGSGTITGSSDDINSQHFVPVERVEQQVDLDPGQSRTVKLSCQQPGQIMTDASFRVDNVDQGTGGPASVDENEARSVDAGTYEITLYNHATGRAQTKVFGVCIAGRTTDTNGHAHDLHVSSPITHSLSWGANDGTDSISCPHGTVAVSPGFNIDGGRPQLTGQPSDNGRTWNFAFEAGDPVGVELSVHCLDTSTSAAAGHRHGLKLTEVQQTFTVDAGAIGTFPVTCPDDAKGIVGSFDMPAGVRMLGHEPQSKTRLFHVLNTHGTPVTIALDLLCVGDRTVGSSAGVVRQGGGGKDPVFTNTAHISGSSLPDPNPSNDSASVDLNVDPNAPPPTLAVPRSAALAPTGDGGVLVPVSCPSGCTGKATVRAVIGTGDDPAAGGSVMKIASGTFSLGKRAKVVRLRLTGKYRRMRGSSFVGRTSVVVVAHHRGRTRTVRRSLDTLVRG
jgi:uncharacterized repeat protein (TIGR01451 family)